MLSMEHFFSPGSYKVPKIPVPSSDLTLLIPLLNTHMIDKGFGDIQTQNAYTQCEFIATNLTTFIKYQWRSDLLAMQTQPETTVSRPSFKLKFPNLTLLYQTHKYATMDGKKMKLLCMTVGLERNG